MSEVEVALEIAAKAACGIGERYDWASRNVGYAWANGGARDYWVDVVRRTVSAYAAARKGAPSFAQFHGAADQVLDALIAEVSL